MVAQVRPYDLVGRASEQASRAVSLLLRPVEECAGDEGAGAVRDFGLNR